MRRYTIGEHRAYDNRYNSAKLNSKILSGGNRPAGDIYSANLGDAQVLKSLKIELVGTTMRGTYWKEERKKQLLTLDQLPGSLTDPFYFTGDGHTQKKGYIPGLLEKLENIDVEVQRRRDAHLLTGRPGGGGMMGFSSEKYRTEAELDIHLEELKEVEMRLARFAKRKRVRESKDMLTKGPTGQGRLRESVLILLAGQRVSMIEDDGKKLVINEPKSIYHGMSTQDYFSQVSAPWTKARNYIRRKKQELEKELHSKGQRGLFQEQWTEMHDKIMEENPEWKDLFSVKFGSRPDMPSFPKGCKNYKKFLDDEE